MAGAAEDRTNIAVVGAGLIGRQHIDRVLGDPSVRLSHIVDPTEAARALAQQHGVPWAPDIAAMLAAGRPDGVIVATPNQLHVEHGLACVAAGLPALIEKPVADDADGARRLVEAAEAAGVPLLIGHHRRHNPLIRAARARIEAGEIGRVVAAHATCWLFKPDSYFDAAWRRQPGAGPVFINLIHDIDLLRHLCGEISAVQAIESSAVRGHPVEETAVILLRFASGALGTVTVSDTIVSPWSWELTSRENDLYQPSGEECYMIGGTHGSLSVPAAALWRNPDERSWHARVERSVEPVEPGDPLALQVTHFREVILGRAEPLVSGREGLNTLEVVAAIKRATRSGTTETVRNR